MTELSRASREDFPGIEALQRDYGWEPKNLDEGEAFVARDGGEIIGLVRVIEVAPETFVVDDVLVREDRRGAGIGAELMGVAMEDRAGTFYLVCHDERVPFYNRLGFERIDESDYAKPALDYGHRIGDLPDRPGHRHRLMRR